MKAFTEDGQLNTDALPTLQDAAPELEELYGKRERLKDKRGQLKADLREAKATLHGRGEGFNVSEAAEAIIASEDVEAAVAEHVPKVEARRTAERRHAQIEALDEAIQGLEAEIQRAKERAQDGFRKAMREIQLANATQALEAASELREYGRRDEELRKYVRSETGSDTGFRWLYIKRGGRLDIGEYATFLQTVHHLDSNPLDTLNVES